METKDLMYKRAYVWDKLNAEERKACMDMGEDYKAFLNESKTERRCAAEIIRRAKEAGAAGAYAHVHGLPQRAGGPVQPRGISYTAGG